MEGLRILSTASERSESFLALLHHRNSLNGIYDMMMSALERVRDQKGTYDPVEVNIICGALWTLQNLSFEPDITK